MPVDTSFYGRNPLRSVADYDRELNARDLQQQQLKANALAFQDRQAKLAEEAQVKNVLSQVRSPEEAIQALRQSGLPSGLTAADSIEKNLIERKKNDITAAKTGAEVTAAHYKLMKDMAGVIIYSPTQQIANGVLDNWEAMTKLPAGAVRQAFQQAGDDPEKIKQIAFSIATEADKLLAKTGELDLGGSKVATVTDPVTGKQTLGPAYAKTPTPGETLTDVRGKEANKIAQGRLGLEREKFAEEKRQFKVTQDNKAKDDADPGKYTQVIIDPDKGPILIDRKTNTWKPVAGAGGQSLEGKNISAAKKLESQLSIGIEEARKLIPIATGSGAGRLVDVATGFAGISTEGDNAASQLETLAGWMTSNVPRMQGPQSDKDTLMYKQMAAQVGDRTKTRAARLKALETLESLQKKYAVSSGGATGSFGDVPDGIDPADWKHMTPQERALWK